MAELSDPLSEPSRPAGERISPRPHGPDRNAAGQASGAEAPAEREAAAGRRDVILSARDIVKVYDGEVIALNGVSLDVERGEVVVVVGPSGCGKSTLLRCLNGLEGIQEGSISFEGEEIPSDDMPWHVIRQRIGMVFQSYELFAHLDVLDNLLLGPVKVQGVPRGTAARRAGELLYRVGLLERARAYPRQLSGGQKQRVAIVRALMMNPELLLLDEITASLDPEMVREVLDVVLELAADGMTMVIVTHEMSFARAIADRVVFMDAGRVVETASPADFFDRPSSERARQFLNTFTFDR